MSYGEIKASRNRCPKARNNGCSCSELPKDIFIISMVDVQRLSPCGRVGLKRVRKIQLLYK